MRIIIIQYANDLHRRYSMKQYRTKYKDVIIDYMKQNEDHRNPRLDNLPRHC